MMDIQSRFSRSAGVLCRFADKRSVLQESTGKVASIVGHNGTDRTRHHAKQVNRPSPADPHGARKHALVFIHHQSQRLGERTDR